MGWTKEELIDQIKVLENNIEVLESRFDNQYMNCLNMVNSMAILNNGYKKRKVTIGTVEHPPSDIIDNINTEG